MRDFARRRTSRLTLQRLEERCTPTVFGTPWSDGPHVTLSFVPDGTSVDGAPNVLAQSLQAGGLTQTAWRTEILRAFYTWSEQANVNVGLVNEVGQVALGAPGPNQGDLRFGDIRVAARPLSDNVLAITTPSGHLGGTRAGDIILNSTMKFSIGGAAGTYDLYTVLLQEAGHAFGIGNSTNIASPMFEQYQGVRTGLTSADISAIKSLYGARTPDALETSSTNNVFDQATWVKYAHGADEAARRSLVARAEITTAGDVDYYIFKTPKYNNGHGVTIKVTTAGFSSLAPRVTLYTKNRAQVAQVQTTDPLKGEVSIVMPAGSFPLDTEYYVKVDSGASGNKYKVGSYQLKLVFDPAAGDVTPAGEPVPLDDPHTNDLVGNAGELQTTPGYVAQTHYRISAVLRDTSDVDFYKFKSAVLTGGQKQTLTVTTRAAAPLSGLAPRLALYDSNKNLIPNATVLVNGDGTFTLQLAQALSNTDYHVGVSAAPSGAVRTGKYSLDVDFRSHTIVLNRYDTGTLTNTDRQDTSALTIHRSLAMHFVLSASRATGSIVQMDILNAAGSVVLSLRATAGSPAVSGSVYLGAGSYTVRYSGSPPSGATLQPLTYALDGQEASDPIGPRYTGDVTNAPANKSVSLKGWDHPYIF